MAGEDIIMARPKELRYLHVIRKVLDREISQVEASEILDLSSRQIRRIVKRVRAEGDKGVVHRTRGRPSNRRIGVEIREKVMKLYRSQYWDFGPTLAAEKLEERDHIKVNDETLRLWLLESGDWKKSRKRRVHRRWRERKAHFGEFVQIDGSHHDWFEGRGPECVLMGYIDDARGQAFARFYDYEGTMPAMDSFRRYIRKYGLPMAVYVDGHTTYKSPAKASLEEELKNKKPLSQFERALEELGVHVDHAHSAQAKGRIERLFKTFQHRLVQEMRLEGVRTVDEANVLLKDYLSKHNRRFSVRPREKGNFHRPLPPGIDLDFILCKKTRRVLRNDFTVAHDGRLYQVEDRTRATRVVVHERINGTMKVFDQGKALRFHEITTRPTRQAKTEVKVLRAKPRPPSPDHPWRGFKFGSHKHEGNGIGKRGDRGVPVVETPVALGAPSVSTTPTKPNTTTGHF